MIITYFFTDKYKEGGAYSTVKGFIKRIDEYGAIVIMRDSIKIPIKHISAIESDLFKDIIDP